VGGSIEEEEEVVVVVVGWEGWGRGVAVESGRVWCSCVRGSG